jgi:hypothetical protein
MVFSGGRRSIFFYCNRKDIEIASLAGLDRNGGRSRTRRPAWEWEYQGCQVGRDLVRLFSSTKPLIFVILL